MKTIISAFLANGVALFIAGTYIKGVSVPLGVWEPFLIITGAFTLITLILKPLLKLVLTPIIFLTFGIASILVNMGLLFLLDRLFAEVSISGLLPLFYTTLLLSVTSIIFHALLRTNK